MVADDLENPPAVLCSGLADLLHGSTDEGFVDRRADIIEFLDCASDFMALQAVVIADLRKGKASIARPDAVEQRRDRWSITAQVRAAMLLGLVIGFLGGLLAKL